MAWDAFPSSDPNPPDSYSYTAVLVCVICRSAKIKALIFLHCMSSTEKVSTALGYGPAYPSFTLTSKTKIYSKPHKINFANLSLIIDTHQICMEVHVT